MVHFEKKINKSNKKHSEGKSCLTMFFIFLNIFLQNKSINHFVKEKRNFIKQKVKKSIIVLKSN